MKRTDPREANPDDEVDPRAAAFLRGVTIGALVGAAIAGSALWERAWRRRAEAARARARREDPPPS